MSARLLPVSRTELVRKLRALGYDGPYPGGRHEFMAAKGKRPVRLPNPHQGDIGVGLLAKILRDAGIDREAWDKA